MLSSDEVFISEPAVLEPPVPLGLFFEGVTPVPVASVPYVLVLPDDRPLLLYEPELEPEPPVESEELMPPEPPPDLRSRSVLPVLPVLPVVP